MSTIVTLKELAQEFNLDRSNMRKFVLAHDLTPFKVRTPESRGQLTLALSTEDAEVIREIRKQEGFSLSGGHRAIIDNGQGWFYVIQIVPDLAPHRIKLGFASNVESRLQAHKTSAPTACLVKTWPCKRTWERAAMDSVPRTDCALVANEVFDCGGVASLTSRCDDFFALMPPLVNLSSYHSSLSMSRGNKYNPFPEHK